MTREEFNKYVRLTARKLYSLAFRLLKKQDEAEDAVQEVFLKMWSMGNKLDDYKNLDALATTMTKNYCIDQLRKGKQVFDNSFLVMNKADDTSTDGIIENAESFIILQKIINGLSVNFRESITMRDVEGLTYEEIAKKTGQNINTIRVNISRARSIVRNEYMKYFNEKRGY
jgi:RNA polymerase sigma-70 factor (ECF subfamily)